MFLVGYGDTSKAFLAKMLRWAVYVAPFTDSFMLTCEERVHVLSPVRVGDLPSQLDNMDLNQCCSFLNTCLFAFICSHMHSYIRAVKTADNAEL